jgi:hypothetical protein
MFQALFDEESQEFPVLHSLKTLLLEECDAGLKFQALTAILKNTPILENLALHHCKVNTYTQLTFCWIAPLSFRFRFASS